MGFHQYIVFPLIGIMLGNIPLYTMDNIYVLTIKEISYTIIASFVIIPLTLFMNRYTPFLLGKKKLIESELIIILTRRDNHNMKELKLSHAYKFIEPGPVILVVTLDHGRPNLMAMSYHMMIEDGERPLIGCMLGSWDHSFGTLLKTGECVLAVPTVELASKIVKIGNCSGIETDKFKTFGLTSVSAGIVKVPLVDECLANLECRIADTSLVDKYNFIVLEVVKAWIDPEHKERRLIHHNGDGTFAVDGEILDLRDTMVRWADYIQR